MRIVINGWKVARDFDAIVASLPAKFIAKAIVNHASEVEVEVWFVDEQFVDFFANYVLGTALFVVLAVLDFLLVARVCRGEGEVAFAWGEGGSVRAALVQRPAQDRQN